MQKHEIEDTAYMLKTIAEELEVAIIVFSHIPRKREKRKDKRPKYSDIKDKKCAGICISIPIILCFCTVIPIITPRKRTLWSLLNMIKVFLEKGTL